MLISYPAEPAGSTRLPHALRCVTEKGFATRVGRSADCTRSTQFVGITCSSLAQTCLGLATSKLCYTTGAPGLRAPQHKCRNSGGLKALRLGPQVMHCSAPLYKTAKTYNIARYAPASHTHYNCDSHRFTVLCTRVVDMERVTVTQPVFSAKSAGFPHALHVRASEYDRRALRFALKHFSVATGTRLQGAPRD